MSKLIAKTRTDQDNLNKIKKNFIPAVLYGPNINNQNLKIQKTDFENIYKTAEKSSLIDLIIDENPSVKILIKNIQKNPIKDSLIHVDLYQVDMNKKITIDVPIKFINESAAVKELGGSLIKYMNSVKIKCLPNDSLNHINIDLSMLKSINDSIKLNDLNLNKNIKIINQTNDIIVTVIQPKIIRKEEKVEKQTEEIEEKKKEDENKK